jgi:hypothetical protein
MESFEKIVVISFALLLCLILVFVGVSLKYSKVTNWPPIVPTCPDFWDADTSGNCINVQGLGTWPKDQPMSFNTPEYNGGDGLCNKYKWATTNNMSWDGITYGVPSPCTASSTLK